MCKITSWCGGLRHNKILRVVCHSVIESVCVHICIPDIWLRYVLMYLTHSQFMEKASCDLMCSWVMCWSLSHIISC